MSTILTRGVDIVRDLVDVDSCAVESTTVGARSIMVELTGPVREPTTNRSMVGLAHRPSGAVGAIETQSVADRLNRLATSGATKAAGTDLVDRAIAIATLNAAAAPFIDWRFGDPMAALGSDIETIATVGLFGPAFRKFEDVAVRVIERRPVEDPPVPAGGTTTVHAPTEAPAAFAAADVVFITGSALVYGGVDEYLGAVPGRTPIVLVGETASLPPKAAFAAGVTVVAGARVVDPGATRTAVADGACGTELHDAGVEKVMAIAPEATGIERFDGFGARPRASSESTGSTSNMSNKSRSRQDI